MGTTAGMPSRHVVIRRGSGAGERNQVYLHLATTSVSLHDVVIQGQQIGTVGDHGNAVYEHLHFEVRTSMQEEDSLHPFSYLSYADSANFTAPADPAFNRLGTDMAARLLFEAPDRQEGDLLRVDVELHKTDGSVTTRTVDLDDQTTYHQDNLDQCAYRGDVALEGYQKSNMKADGRDDLKYGVVVRDIPSDVSALLARAVDVGGNVASSGLISVPSHAAVEETVDFESWPPAGWSVLPDACCGGGSGSPGCPGCPGPGCPSCPSGISTAQDCTSATHTGATGSCSMRSVDTNTNAKDPAGLEIALPTGRFEWLAEGWFNPESLAPTSNGSVYLLHFLHDDEVSVAARIRRKSGKWKADVVAYEPDTGTWLSSEDSADVNLNDWRKWRLHVYRLGTRESTAVLYLDDPPVAVAKRRWDSSRYPPNVFRAGIGRTPLKAITATVLTDDVRLTELTPSATTTCP